MPHWFLFWCKTLYLNQYVIYHNIRDRLNAVQDTKQACAWSMFLSVALISSNLSKFVKYYHEILTVNICLTYRNNIKLSWMILIKQKMLSRLFDFIMYFRYIILKCPLKKWKEKILGGGGEQRGHEIIVVIICITVWLTVEE